MPLKIQNYEIYTDFLHDEVRLRFVSNKSVLSFPAHEAIIWCHLGSSESKSYASLNVDVRDEQNTFMSVMFFKMELSENEMQQIMSAFPFLYISYAADQENPYETTEAYCLRKLIDPRSLDEFTRSLDEWRGYYIMGKSFDTSHYDAWYQALDHSLDILPEGTNHDLHKAFASHTLREQIRKHIHID